MLLLVVSDMHLGKGKFLPNGQINILEDFDEDEKFIEFLDHYSTNKHYFSDVHLVLNGDILNLIQMDIDCIFTHLITEEMTVKMVSSIFEGHPEFFTALKRFLSRPNKKITYVIGNHDFAMVWPAAQKYFKEKVYKTVIPRNVRLSEAPSHGVPCIVYDRACLGSKSYLQLAKEFMDQQIGI